MMTDSTGLPQSIFVSDNAEVHDVPMSVITRPIPSVLDEEKVQEFTNKIRVRADGELVAVTAACRLSQRHR